MLTRPGNWFVKTVGLLLLLTGLANVLSGGGKAGILAIPDPLLILSFRRLMFLVGTAELIVGFVCLSRKATLRLKAGLLAWLAAAFVVYRIGLWFVTGPFHAPRVWGAHY